MDHLTERRRSAAPIAPGTEPETPQFPYTPLVEPDPTLPEEEPQTVPRPAPMPWEPQRPEPTPPAPTPYMPIPRA